MRRTVITLLTDFGTADGYVGEVKGMLCGGAPDAVLVDIAHDLPAHDVTAARVVLERYWRRFPPGTVHLVVVDPGVGSGRRALAVAADGRFLVGPDNGVLSAALALDGARVVAIPVGAEASPTFHGRDVFAPAAARLARGDGIEALGEPVTPVVVPTPVAARSAQGWRGVVVAVDRFGNAITNLPAGVREVRVAGRSYPVVRTYADVASGQATALVGSAGHIEIAVRDGRAADQLGLSRGDVVDAS